jgi:hypothetical protein
MKCILMFDFDRLASSKSVVLLHHVHDLLLVMAIDLVCAL